MCVNVLLQLRLIDSTGCGRPGKGGKQDAPRDVLLGMTLYEGSKCPERSLKRKNFQFPITDDY